MKNVVLSLFTLLTLSCAGHLPVVNLARYKTPTTIIIYDTQNLSAGKVSDAICQNFNSVLKDAFIKFGPQSEVTCPGVSPHYTCAGTPGFQVIAREQLQEILEEKKIQSSGLTDEASAIRYGKLANAKLALTSSVLWENNSGTHVNAKLLDLETGIYLKSYNIAIEESTQPADIASIPYCIACNCDTSAVSNCFK